ncbi:hypothetical protein N7448_006436 [Penicillium atrosanguineum]|uniref:Uncharacterized protein n=1 Tax=Penicillium atrosanguineum TaxID=1132637 RepID=A0A9W9PRL4_9EURO|nr:40S ribosomal protein S21 [Penicillium atrosanguineum]KAJ5132278.1 hypothetical protein N7448_006436 [Penicillium atrosanguineum]KAJ5289943.1 40S ribosomal protein S21 [Penicillium atrosanguineum]KAJ5307767.1 hypothetical protein N7476_008423 [Penicillium atrosanguineum]
MPHKVNNDSNSTLASRGSAGDPVVATEVRSESPTTMTAQVDLQNQANTRSPAANPARKPPVIVHNQGGQIYDETRPSDWDKQRWK